MSTALPMERRALSAEASCCFPVEDHQIRLSAFNTVFKIIAGFPPHGKGIETIPVPVSHQHQIFLVTVGDHRVGLSSIDAVFKVVLFPAPDAEGVEAVSVPVSHQQSPTSTGSSS